MPGERSPLMRCKRGGGFLVRSPLSLRQRNRKRRAKPQPNASTPLRRKRKVRRKRRTRRTRKLMKKQQRVKAPRRVEPEWAQEERASKAISPQRFGLIW